MIFFKDVLFRNKKNSKKRQKYFKKLNHLKEQ